MTRRGHWLVIRKGTNSTDKHLHSWKTRRNEWLPLPRQKIMQIKSNHIEPKQKLIPFNFRSEVPDCRRPNCIHSRRQVYTAKFSSYTWDVTSIHTLRHNCQWTGLEMVAKAALLGCWKLAIKNSSCLTRWENIYLKWVSGKVYQINLWPKVGKPNELVPLCVLDFYVAERRQRSGCGSKLFQHMLIEQRADPR